jgi:hypothetical protein
MSRAFRAWGLFMTQGMLCMACSMFQACFIRVPSHNHFTILGNWGIHISALKRLVERAVDDFLSIVRRCALACAVLLCDADIADVGRDMKLIGLEFSKWCAASASIFGDVTNGLRFEGPSRLCPSSYSAAANTSPFADVLLTASLEIHISLHIQAP